MDITVIHQQQALALDVLAMEMAAAAFKVDQNEKLNDK